MIDLYEQWQAIDGGDNMHTSVTGVTACDDL